MTATLLQGGRGRLERLCKLPSDDGAARSDRIRIGSGAVGIERLEAHFVGQAYAPHRHDTYAIGITLAGVQVFHYRGEQRHCLPGQCHILHPDEIHDGGAGTEDGFGYRIIYLDPGLIQQALAGRALPFARSPVVDASRLPAGFASDAWDINAEIDDLTQTDIVLGAANLLRVAASDGVKPSRPVAFIPVSRIRDLIAASPATRHAMADLERVAGLDRWTLARQFRAIFGTSPSRFRTLRQLDLVRRSLIDGVSLAAAAADAGFADQSHMSRHFKRAYGLTPASWVAAIA